MNTRIGFWSSVVGVSALAISASALADPYWAHDHGHHHEREYREYREDDQYARVIGVDPIMRRVRVSAPSQDCWDESRTVYPQRGGTAGSTIVGGLIGGVIGHQFGHGDRHIGTIAGSVIGAAIGNDVGARRAAENDAYAQPVERTVQRCNVSYRDEWEDRIDGYRVTYVYRGREFTTRMPYDPGPRVRVNVDVTPEW
jgi:uncharacterized protein YcfJ